MSLKNCHNFSDFRKLAKRKLPSPIFHYIDGAADDEVTYARNTSAFEFKSEIKVGFDILENSKLGYSYSHISNNDWGSTNPGTDNQQITFSTKF